MFGFKSARKTPEMGGFARSFSTTTAKCPLNDFHIGFDFSINSQKKFSNPNFVNKQNPNLIKCQSAPMRVCAEPPDEVGVDPLSVSSSPICIAVNTAQNEITISITPESFGRNRLNSDCTSEDSFIIFDCGSEENCSNDGKEETDNTYDSDENNYDSDENNYDSDEDTDESDVDEVDFVRNVPIKKVRFSDKPSIHRMIKWDYAYRAARKGPWEECVRDRCRFEKRIEDLSEILNPILSKDHRNKVYEERFKNRTDD